jgi:hypothetical protein
VPNLISCSEQIATSTAKLRASHIRNKFSQWRERRSEAQRTKPASVVRKTQTEKKKNSELKIYLDRGVRVREGIRS